MKLFLSVLLFISFAPTFSFAELSGKEIVERADEVMIGNSAKYECEMIIKRTGKANKVSKFLYFFKQRGVKVFIKVLSPAKEVGKDILLLNDNIWVYLPKAEKSIRIAKTQKFMGGDFNNFDILNVSLLDDYNATLKSIEQIEGEEYYVLDLKAKSRSVTYDRVRYVVRKTGFLPYGEDYYTLSGKLIKRLRYKDVGHLGDRNRPRILVIENKLKKGYQTMLLIKSAKYNISLPDRMFTRSYLEQDR